MGLKNANKEELKTSNDEPNTIESGKTYSDFNNEQLKLINKFTSMRESIINMVQNRFPIKGIDTVIKQAFNEAIAKNLEEIEKYFIKTLHAKFQKNPKVHEPSRQIKNDETFENASNNINQESYEKKSKENLINSRELTEGFLTNSTKSLDINTIEQNYQKRVDQLILEIKSRDKRLKEKQEQIEELKNRLEILEQQNIPPFLENWETGKEYGQEEIEQLQNQIRRWEMLWQKLKPYFDKDPKFRTLFILQRLGSINIDNLSKSLELDLNQTETLLQELQKASFVKINGDNVSINSDD
ncbi:MAG: hypothetical protein ACUVXA_10425 [Candidatus Jordarchaeum sp.]|uniref:hypothetical protein n=1 Tax=Candidatus Jordarchaeum sp. TaxID=2823881 RepID=UPI0040494F8F